MEVYNIMDKVFVFFLLNPKQAEYFVVLKCDPEKTVELREKYQGITKGYYRGGTLMYNSVYIQKNVPNELIVDLIEHSAKEALRKLSKKKQEEYRTLDSKV